MNLAFGVQNILHFAISTLSHQPISTLIMLGEPLRRRWRLASGYPRFASLIPARFALGTARFAHRRYYPSRNLHDAKKWHKN
jgi:hypothetical protein